MTIELFKPFSALHALIKRESGANPERSRRCESQSFSKRHWETGKAKKTFKLESEDLPLESRQALRVIECALKSPL
jgi:hypothetical protein